MANRIESTESPESVETIREFLKTHATGTLLTADIAANPYGAVVYYTIDDDFNLGFVTKTETQKYKNIEQNNQVAFVCYDETTQTSVQLNGRAEVVKDAAIQEKMINAMHRLSETTSTSTLPPLEKLLAGYYVAVRIIPQVIKLSVYVRPDAEANEELYEVVTFSDD